MRDDPSLRRQWLLLKALSARRLGMTVREMADEHGVADKTIRRDLDLFRRLGFPVAERVGEFGRKSWRIASVGGQPPTGFAFDEAVALYLGRRLLDPLAGTALADAARRAGEKVRAMLGEGALAYLDRFEGVFHPTAFGVHDYADRSEAIETLQVACEDRTAVRLAYRSERADRPSDREVHPLALVLHRGALYLVAFDPGSSRVKHYKVDRVEAAEPLGRGFEPPEGFDPAAHLARAFGVYHRDGPPTRVVVRFAPEAARYVGESRWHPGQRLEPQADGGLLAEFRVCGTEELKRWVLGFGSRAVVLEPEPLRREVAEELRLLASAYGIEADRPAPPTCPGPRPARAAGRRPRTP